MRWLVMAQSKTYMTINYALMVEVQKTHTGHRLKIQWDSRALDMEQASKALELYNDILMKMEENDGELGRLLGDQSELRGLWKA